jgi:prevent-host-death family protein
MTTVTSEEVRDSLGELINRVKYHQERMKVTRRGKPVMALVPLEDLKFLEDMDAYEDALDLPIVRQRLEEFDRTGIAIPWEQVKAEAGL